MRARRRGVLLLIVLALLAMFGLVGITFVVLTSQAQRGSEAQRRVGQYDEPPDNLTHQVALQVLRGSDNPASVLRNHSLLEDIYGPPVYQGPLSATAAITPVAGGQLYEFPIADPDMLRYCGCVLSMRSGNAAGQSTRIVGFRYDTAAAQYYLQFLAFPGGQVPVGGDLCVINGAPFSGTGFGYDPTATSNDPLLRAKEPDPLAPLDPARAREYALLPNPVSFVGTGTYLDPSGPGGANEDYDAPDYQNMPLAWQIPEATTLGVLTLPAGTTPIPSLHRPELVNYWFQRLAADASMSPAWTKASLPEKAIMFRNAATAKDLTPQDRLRIAQLKRRILFRPLPEDHPDFDGGNTGFYVLWDGYTNPVGLDLNGNGTIEAGETLLCRWDVDNDGDGIPDSIWVDVGLPVRSTKDGRLYKPLAAILCLDLDGRLNLNAHGTLAQTNVPPASLTGPFAAGGANVLVVPRGQACGPAEVNLMGLFLAGPLDPPPTSHAEYAQLLTGVVWAGQPVAGRYGLPGAATPGIETANLCCPLSRNQLSDYPGAYDGAVFASTPAAALAYGSPMDLKGLVAVGLDLRGQPLYYHGLNWTNLWVDQPYELNLARDAASADHPFSPAELERLLRPFDADAQTLPNRLLALAWAPPAQPTLLQRRHDVTTESRSLPVPSVAWTADMRTNALGNPTRVNGRTSPAHVTDLLRARGVSPANLRFLLPPELMAGVRMDLNRPFGNGLDDNGNGVVDEPGELLPGGTPELIQQVDAAGTAIAPPVEFDDANGMDVNGNGTVDQADRILARQRGLVRQLYARHLYVQMLLMMDYKVANPGSPSTAEKDAARQVAQWAVNIVDFRDRDAIMTPFEYDVDPFHDDSTPPDGNPWDVDGIVGTTSAPSPDDTANSYRGLVWGCERPELLITETMAMHDRRTEDLSTDDGDAAKTTDPPPNSDDDFDQRIKPQGSLFVELHNPWNGREAPPAELSASGGIDLTRVVVAGPKTSPVWRLAIVGIDPARVPKPNDPARKDLRQRDPDDPVAADRPAIERTVYFVGSSVELPAEGTVRFQPNNAMSRLIAPILPGRYALVGPGEPADTTTSTTYFGFRQSQTQGDNQTRRIVLAPSKDLTAKQVSVFSNGTVDDLTGKPIEQATAIVINWTDSKNATKPRLSMTEPPGGYEEYPGGMTTYNPPKDAPLDKGGPFWDSARVSLKDNGTFTGIWMVHLQRLADPTQPYEPDANPYRTIDSASVDLASFNGATDARDKKEDGTDAAIVARERGAKGTLGANNLWAQDSQEYLLTAAAAQGPVIAPSQKHYFDEGLTHTLGYLNAAYGPPVSLGAGSGYVGVPQNPFPWFAWLNRPFAGEMELFLVPKERSSTLLRDLSLATGNPANDDPYQNASRPFGHLVNYFYDNAATGQPVDWRLYRFLDFVRVPSRFAGAELQGNPTAFYVASHPVNVGAHAFNPPFNRVPGLHDPGLVNLNTIASPRVWRGLTDFAPATDATWARLLQSRRGYSFTAPSPAEFQWAMNNASPTRFENPFRSSAGKFLVPTTELKDTDVKEEVNATLLRPDPTTAAKPLFEFTSANPQNNTDRNPYFRYGLYERLGSMTTTRSNVYAVWITVGCFEVEPWSWVNSGATNALGQPINAQGLTLAEFQRVYPDGYRLGRELGSETGETARHRAFYIMDRSIPVGFQRGKDLNVENAILLRRFIE